MNTERLRAVGRDANAGHADEPDLTVERMRQVVNQQPILVYSGLAILFCAFVLI